ncbi:MAG: hypothetical protein EHM20_03010, partial [Alphaproteobacteria bacterium]
MMRKTKKKNTKKTNSCYQLKKHKYRLMESPFKDLNQEQLREAFRIIGENSEKEYNEQTTILKKIIYKYDPILLISIISFYGQTIPVIKNQYCLSEPHIPTHLVEILQAFLLTNPINEYSLNSHSLAPQSEIDEIIASLEKITTSIQYMHYRNIDVCENNTTLWIINFIRSNTLAVRNWGYPQQISSVINEIYGPIDNEIEQTLGYKITLIYEVFEKIKDIITNKTNILMKIKTLLYKAKNTEEFVNLYNELIPTTTVTVHDINRILKQWKVDFNTGKLELLSHSDLYCNNIFTINTSDFFENYSGNYEKDKIQHFLDSISLSFGDLHDYPEDRIFLDNPIWEKPFIKLDCDVFLLPIPNLLSCFCMQLFDNILSPNEHLLSIYLKNKSIYLQKHTEEVIKQAFPKAEIWSENLWGDIYENDILIKIDSYLFVIELKSGKISDSARRGSDIRLKNDLKKIILDSSIQTTKFIDFLCKQKGYVDLKSKSGVVTRIDLTTVYSINGFNVSFEVLSFMGTQINDMQRAGILPKDIEVIPCISIHDLEIIFEILETSCEKIHYLVRRSEFSKNAKFIGDEMDLLSFYIDTGFNIGEDEYSGQPLHLWGMSEDFDPYFMKTYTGKNISKPRRHLTKWWRSILEKLEERQTPRWSELGVILLNVTHKDQDKLEREFIKRQNYVRKESDWKKKNAVILTNGPKQRKDGVVCIAYKQISIED